VVFSDPLDILLVSKSGTHFFAQCAELAEIVSEGRETVFHVLDMGFGVCDGLSEGAPEVTVFAGTEVILARDVEGPRSAYHDEVGDFCDMGGKDDFSSDFNKWHYAVVSPKEEASAYDKGREGVLYTNAAWPSEWGLNSLR
jgi:hypothetical protein